MTISTNANPELDDRVRPYWMQCGKALREFNKFVVQDARVDVTMLPLFDGVSLIKWKLGVSGEDPVDVDEAEVGGTSGGNTSGFAVSATGDRPHVSMSVV